MRPWVVLKHFQIPFKEIFVQLGQPDSKEKLLQYSPSGKVPVLIHDGLTIWESLAILEYLVDLFPEKGIWPKDPKAKAVARAVSCEMHAGFMDLRKACPMNVRAQKPETKLSEDVLKDVSRLVELWEVCRRQFGQGGDFLFGRFSAADAMFAPVIWRFNTYGIKVKGEAQNYFLAMMNLPVMQEWHAAALKEPYVMPY